eukprot:scaffold11351_cov141-Isochrysis_galbana.AAC.2
MLRHATGPTRLGRREDPPTRAGRDGPLARWLVVGWVYEISYNVWGFRCSSSTGVAWRCCHRPTPMSCRNRQQTSCTSS